MFSRETVQKLRSASRGKDFPAPLFFVQGNPDEARSFFGRFWPEARAVSDPEHFFFDAFGARRGSWWQLLGPRVWVAALRALFKGNSIGRPVGDPRRMPALVLVRDEKVVWQHEFRHAGDLPDSPAIPWNRVECCGLSASPAHERANA